MKLREELETVVGDGETLLRVPRGARLSRLVPLPEVPRGVRARRRHHRDRRDAGRHVRRDRGRRGRHPRRRRARSAARRPTTSLDSYRSLFLKHRARARPARRPTWCSTTRTWRLLTCPARCPPRRWCSPPGLGTRLRPLTLVRAKPALPVAGEPLVARILALARAPRRRRRRRSTCTTGPRRITRVVGDGAELGVRVRYSWEQPRARLGRRPARARFSLVARRSASCSSTATR